MIDLGAQLGQLETAQLIRHVAEEEATYMFKHTLTQDTAYQSLLHTQRREIHRRVAQAYEAQYGDQCLDEYAGILAQHYAEAGDDEHALVYSIHAGDLAARIYANAEAIAFYTQALTLGSKRASSQQLQHLYTRRGRVYELMNRYDDALNNYAEMENLAHERSDRTLELGALMARATIHSTPTAKFDLVQASDCSERSLALARELNDQPAQAKALWNLMLLYHFQQRFQEAIVYGEQSIALARQLNLREQLAYSLNDISRAYGGVHQPENSIRALDEAREIWRVLDNKPMLADNLASAGNGYYYLGEYDRALALTNEAFHLAQAINNPWNQSFALLNIGFIYLDRGEIERALKTMEECLRLGRLASFSVAVGAMIFTLAKTYADMGDVAKGFEILEEFKSPLGNLASQEGVRAIFIHLYLRQGNLTQARKITEQINAFAPKMPDSMWQILELLATTELTLAEQDYARTIDYTDQWLALSERTFTSINNKVQVLHMKGKALIGQGKINDAEETLNHALAEARRVGIRRLEWEILLTLSQLDDQRDNVNRARTFRVQAGEIIEYIAAHTPEELRQCFMNLPNVRNLMKAR